MADSRFVVSVTAEDFYQVVLEGSHRQPVLVDFWADWCAPCRMLMPVLASLAEEYQGKFIVAKVNTEEQRELAAQYGIRSLPTVQLFRNGQPVDQFMGALPESQVREFLDRHLPRESDQQLTEAEALLAGGDVTTAASLIEQAYARDPGNRRVVLAYARLKALGGAVKEAETLLDKLPLDEQDNPEVTVLRGQLHFADVAATAPPEAELRQAVAANEANGEARYQLAARRVLAEDFEQALDQLFLLMGKDRAYGDDAGRKGMLKVFDILGNDSALAQRYRSQMFNALH